MPRIRNRAPAAPVPGWRRWLRRGAITVLLMAAASVLLVLVLRFVPPPTSAFMLERRLHYRAEGQTGMRIDYRWRPLSEISPNLPIACVAGEDQKFPKHHGFDFDSMRQAWQANRDGKSIRGASTISQQVAKNLFLWPGRNLVRKGVEAWFTVLIEALWPKRRILEVYVNIAEFGDGIYGAEAAAQRLFHKPAAALSARESALLASTLPSPRTLSAAQPSPYVQQNAAWVEQQVRQLGGPAYLEPR